jgi:hypothetical protein
MGSPPSSNWSDLIAESYKPDGRWHSRADAWTDTAQAPPDHDHQEHPRIAAGLVDADKINPRHWPPDSSAIDPTTGVNGSVSTHDNSGI